MTFDSIDEPNTFGLVLIWIGWTVLLIMFIVKLVSFGTTPGAAIGPCLLFLFILLQYVVMVWGKPVTKLEFLGDPNTRENIYLILMLATGLTAAFTTHIVRNTVTQFRYISPWEWAGMCVIAVMNIIVFCIVCVQLLSQNLSALRSVLGDGENINTPSKRNDLYLVTTIINSVLVTLFVFWFV
jgi:hypothetical protein